MTLGRSRLIYAPRIDMLSLQTAALSFVQAPLPAQRASVGCASAVAMGVKEELAESLCPAIGYWDPLGLADADFWSQGNDATWGFLRQAEIKHGRVAMAAFVGYCVQANGIHFPYLIGQPTFGDTPEEQWFNLPVAVRDCHARPRGARPGRAAACARESDSEAYPHTHSPPPAPCVRVSQGRAQILGFIGFLEFWGEFGGEHYMKGGKPGVYPPFTGIPFHKGHLERFPLYDPAGIASKNSPEKKAKGLLAEINNGRLAMIGIMGFVAESKVPGAVPAIAGKIAPFTGDVMAPLV